MDKDIHRWEKQEALDIALVTAAQLGNAQLVRLIVNAGANVHAHEEGALMWAAMNGHTEIVDLLLSSGADPHGDKALMYAAKNGHKETTLLLIEWAEKSRAKTTPSSNPKPLTGPSP